MGRADGTAPSGPPWGRLGSGDWQLAEGVAAVDEEPGAGPRRQGQALQDLLSRLRVTTVKRPDADGEDEVVRRFVGLEGEVLGRDLADLHAARGDLVGRGGSGLGDGSGGSVDGQHVSGDESGCYGSGRRPRSAPDLEHAAVRLEGERVHDRRKARRRTYGHELGVVDVVIVCEPLDSRGSSLVELDVEAHPGELVPREGAQHFDLGADAADVESL